MTELDRVISIYSDMGFNVIESNQLDDEFHMFDSLNFPKEHPARDGYDSFRTSENFIPPAHTSTMQHRASQEIQERSLKAAGKLPSSFLVVSFAMKTQTLLMNILSISARGVLCRRTPPWVKCLGF